MTGQRARLCREATTGPPGNKGDPQMLTKRAFLSSVAGAATLAATTRRARAVDQIKIMVGGYEKQIYLPAKLCEALGYFREEGLDIELLNEEAGVDAEN